MKVMELRAKKVIEVGDSYGERLIGQGMAILPPNTHKAEKEPQREQPKEPRKKG